MQIQRRGLRPFGSWALLGTLVVACAHQVPLQSTAFVPAAAGQLKLKEGPSGNTRLKVEVEHLADPGKVVPGASTYVVWVQSNDSNVQNVGALRVDDDRKGRLETTTPYGNFQIFITAEPGATATRPSGERLMFANIRK